MFDILKSGITEENMETNIQRSLTFEMKSLTHFSLVRSFKSDLKDSVFLIFLNRLKKLISDSGVLSKLVHTDYCHCIFAHHDV